MRSREPTLRAIKEASGPNPAAPSLALRRAVAFWPWLLVAAAWTLALLAWWTHQQYLINHGYLLIKSSLPPLATLLLFLAGWQVMTAPMMLPSSLPMVSLLAAGPPPRSAPAQNEGRDSGGLRGNVDGLCHCLLPGRYRDSRARQRMARSGTPPLTDRRNDLHRGGWVSVKALQGVLPEDVPESAGLLCARYYQRGVGQ
ncbi:MAG TPA: hypothetical protein VH540_06110 [Ktedonobacterales bacterium]